MPESLDKANKMKLSDKIVGGVAILGLVGGLMASYSDNNSRNAEQDQAISAIWTKLGDLKGTNERLVRLEEKIDNLNSTNDRTLEVLKKLAESVDKLSVSVGRLDERTQALERGRE